MWDPSRHVVVISPNIDFAKSSTSDSYTKSHEKLDSLKHTFGTGMDITTDAKMQDESAKVTDLGVIKEESDDNILRVELTEYHDLQDEIIPVDPVIPRGAGVPAR